MSEGPKTVGEYIDAQAEAVKPLLTSVRETVKQAVPDAEETIGYGIPSYKLGGKYLLHFGAAKDHIGLYATPDGHARFEPKLSKYKRGKGSVQFPMDKPLPLDLVRRIAIYRAEQLRK